MSSFSSSPPPTLFLNSKAKSVLACWQILTLASRLTLSNLYRPNTHYWHSDLPTVFNICTVAALDICTFTVTRLLLSSGASFESWGVCSNCWGWSVHCSSLSGVRNNTLHLRMHLCVNALCTLVHSKYAAFSTKACGPEHAIWFVFCCACSSWSFKLGSETLRDRGGERGRDDYLKDCTRGETGAMVMQP